METKKAIVTSQGNTSVSAVFGGFARGMVAVNAAQTYADIETIGKAAKVAAESSAFAEASNFAIIGCALLKAKEMKKAELGRKVSNKDYDGILDLYFDGMARSTAFQYEKCFNIFCALQKRGVAVDGSLIRALAKVSAEVLDEVMPMVGNEIATLKEFNAWKDARKGVVAEATAEDKTEGKTEGKAEDKTEDKTKKVVAEVEDKELPKLDIESIVKAIREYRARSIVLNYGKLEDAKQFVAIVDWDAEDKKAVK